MNNLNTRQTSLFLLILFAAEILSAQAPAGYYDSAEGLKQKALLQKLCSIISSHTNVGYNGLWNVYADSDIRPGTNYIWDMYSTAKYTLDKGKCGNYSHVGDCYNREHSFPKSWFDDKSPMYSDAFHIYPTDGKVNGQRSNLPYGECANGESEPSYNGVVALGKRGTSTFPGYTGTVFEPDDEYKGDFARTYFYMATCYNDKISTWDSPMLAGNNYPCYKAWAINLLLKWHRQDPVSQKEIDRNNAVYKHQKNRNPYIDHPELAEYIWGDKQTAGWVPGGEIDPVITSPTDGKTFDLGVAALGKQLTATITVKGQGLKENLNVSVSGTGFRATPTTINSTYANADGVVVTVTYSSATATTATGSLTISSSEATSTVNLKAQAVDGIPALPASGITMDSFVANWTDIDMDGSNYKLSVFYADGTTLLQGYPVTVAASAQKHTVTGLDYSAVYKYSLSNTAGKQSNVVSVTTAEPPRTITASVPEGILQFRAAPFTASDPAAVDIETEYIEEDITVKATGGFQISTDKTDWQTQLTIDRDGERIYVRMPGLAEGVYNGILSAYTPTVDGFDVDLIGDVAASFSFIEDFEQGEKDNNYNRTYYEGSACNWVFSNAGICARTSGDKFHDKQGVCFGKNAGSFIYMDEDKQFGAGTFAFYAAPYGSDENPVLDVYYSVNSGTTWTLLESVSITSAALTEYRLNAKIEQPVRFKIQKKEGNRVCIDDISISDFFQTGSIGSTAISDWDAYVCNGQVVVEVSKPSTISIYSIDAKKVFEAEIGSNTAISLPKGVYIVVNGDDSRKTIVK